jgi:hypothetical protein
MIPRSLTSSSLKLFSSPPQTLVLAEPIVVARDHPKPRRVAPEFRIGELGILVEEIELEWAQSGEIRRSLSSLAGARRWACQWFWPRLASPSIPSHFRWTSESPEPLCQLPRALVVLSMVDHCRPPPGHIARVTPVTNRSQNRHLIVRRSSPHRFQASHSPWSPRSAAVVVPSSPAVRSWTGQLGWPVNHQHGSWCGQDLLVSLCGYI